MIICRAKVAILARILFLLTSSNAQTSTSCNPLDTTCSADTALGKSISVDFTSGASDLFTGSGDPTYGSDGVVLTVSESGDAPTLTSTFYIMFGRVEVSLKAATGDGIVSSLVLLSDDLDEIDAEWMGYDGANLQTMYFDQGVGPSSRLNIVPVANNQEEFIDYALDWTSERIEWIASGTVLRTLEAGNASTSEYPQTPMQVKLGAWSAGDSDTNAEGTVEWAHGPTNYSQGPFNMYVKSIKVTDYSTGNQYEYGDTTGSWKSIVAVDGTINGNLDSVASLSVTATMTATATASNIPTSGIGGIGGGSSTTDVPKGWTMTTSGKVVPSSSVAVKFDVFFNVLHRYLFVSVVQYYFVNADHSC
ncbi:Family 16 glycoside hydrolase [Pleurostoma richardsiae]|uniref:Family 16 glycoside hydrolase n=1 Tax=Pleurostoma richardsiae TaxID=41990 RepID=A0AA38RYL1_9PEZI|nr:Family 16 glycoside hydrolase [Pleurostoma richardsiae]